MPPAYILRDILYPHTSGDGIVVLQRGELLLGEEGHVISSADGSNAVPLYEVRGEGRMLVLPVLRNAYVELSARSHSTGSHSQATILNTVVSRSLRSGVTDVHIASSSMLAAGVTVQDLQRNHPAVQVFAEDSRSVGVVCVRSDSVTGSLVFPSHDLKLGTGSLAVAAPDMWEEMRSLLLVQQHRSTNGVVDVAAVLSAATKRGKATVQAGDIADLVVLYMDETWGHVDEHTLQSVLLRAQEADVCGVFVGSKVVFKKQALGERVFTLNPQTQSVTQNGTTNGHHHGNNKVFGDESLGGDSFCEFDRIEDAIKDIADGKFVVVVDNEDRENEGDLIIAAEAMTTEKMAFMIRFCSGLICIPALPSRMEDLQLPLMVTANNESFKTAFTVSVDYLPGTTTGISASDRAITSRAFADPKVKPEDFARPGHMFPLRYAIGGTLVRMGHTEAAIDLCKLAGIYPCGVLCEIALDDGTMARRDYLRSFSRHHGLKMITIADIIRYRRANNLIDI